MVLQNFFKINVIGIEMMNLKKLWKKEVWNKRHLQIIFFGREHCQARHHDLNDCMICCWAASKKRKILERNKQ